LATPQYLSSFNSSTR